jgi:hypothetical protein
MKKLIFAITILTFVACKKEYTCQCTNPGGTKGEHCKMYLLSFKNYFIHKY